ncbi:MAG: magnesium transporter CorA family protein, partial [Leptospiraceae bacterium]|nr:magnesium transporter CorA family protein [Leptospiraceae bacterium]
IVFGGSWYLTESSKKQIISNEPISNHRKKNNTWIHLTPENEEELELLLRNFKIHPLTIEDLMNPLSRIKVEQFPHYTFIVFRGMYLNTPQIKSKNFNFLVLNNLLITISLDHRHTISDIIMDWDKNKILLGKGIEYIMHRILDIETDQILPIVYRIEDQATDFESRVYHRDKSLEITSVFLMRANLQQIKKNINSHIEILKEIETGKVSFISVESDAFFRDVRDHSLRILEISENVKDIISSALEVHLTISTQKSNEIMTILTMMTAVMLPMSLIAGLYGMNFKFIPFLSEPNGFFYSLGSMGIVGFVMFVYFKMKNWF